MKAVELLQKGLPLTHVARVLGLAHGTVSHYATWGRRQGLLGPTAQYNKPRLLGVVTPEVYLWLIEITPEGASLLDTVGAILNDAYHEENP